MLAGGQRRLAMCRPMPWQPSIAHTRCGPPPDVPDQVRRTRPGRCRSGRRRRQSRRRSSPRSWPSACADPSRSCRETHTKSHTHPRWAGARKSVRRAPRPSLVRQRPQNDVRGRPLVPRRPRQPHAHGDDDLAACVSLLNGRRRLGRVGQRVRPVEDRCEFPASMRVSGSARPDLPPGALFRCAPT